MAIVPLPHASFVLSNDFPGDAQWCAVAFGVLTPGSCWWSIRRIAESCGVNGIYVSDMLVSLAAEVGLPAQVCAAAGEASSLEAERLQVLLATSPPIALQLRALILDARLRMGQVAAVRTALGEMSDYERNCGELRDVLGALALLDGDPLAAADVVAPVVNGSAPSHHVGVIVHALVVDALGPRPARRHACVRRRP